MTDRDFAAEMRAVIDAETSGGPYVSTVVALLWLTGEQQGIGATRSQGYGRYEVTRWERLK